MAGLRILVLLLVFLHPLILSKHGIFEFEFVKIWILYTATCVGWFLVAVMPTRIRLPRMKFWEGAFLVLFIVFYALSAATGLSIKDSLIGRYGVWLHSFLSLLVFLSLAYFGFLATGSGKEKFLRDFSCVFLISGILVSLFSLVTELYPFGRIISLDTRIDGTFVHPNHFGFYLTVLFVFSFWEVLVGQERFTRRVAFISCILSFVSLLLTQSRGSWLAVLLTMVVSFLLRKKLLSFFLGKHMMVFLAFIFFLIFFSPIVKNRVVGSFRPDDIRSSPAIRLNEWTRALQIWKDRWLLGIGPTNIDLVYPRYRSVQENLIPEEWQWRTITIRNYYLELLATIGPIGLISFLGVLFAGVYRGRVNARSFSFAAGILAYAVHAFFYSINSTSHMLNYLMLGIVFSYTSTRGKDKQDRGMLPVGLRLGIGMLVSLALIALILVFLSELLGLQASLYLISGKKDNRMEGYRVTKKSYALNPIFDKNLRQLLLSQMLVIKDSDSINGRIGLLEEYKNSLKTLETGNTQDIENLKSLTSGYMRYASFTNGSYDRAIGWGKSLIEIDPTGPGSWDTLGIVYLEAKQYDKALETFHYIIYSLKSDYPYAYFHIGETYLQMGEPKEAIPYYEKAEALGYGGAKEQMRRAKEMINRL